MFRIAVLVSGGGTNLQAIIDATKNGLLDGVKIELVVSSNNTAFALERAKRNNIEAVVLKKGEFGSSNEYEQSLLKLIKDKNINLVVLAGFMIILSEKFISELENKIINIHPSLIPSFCGNGLYGLKVHEAAIKKGVKITGATVHFVNAAADDGPIILQKAVEVSDDDTPEVLQKRVMEQAEWIILPEAIRLIADNKVSVFDFTCKIRKESK